MLLGKVSIIDRRYLAADGFFHIAAGTNPFCPQCRQAFGYSDVQIRIAPRTARVVNTNRLVHLDFARHRLRRRERNLAEGNVDLGMQLACDVNLAGIWQWRFRAVRFDGGIFGCDHAWKGLLGASDEAGNEGCLRGPSSAARLRMTESFIKKRPCAEERHGFESLLPATVLSASGSRGQLEINRALSAHLAPPQWRYNQGPGRRSQWNADCGIVEPRTLNLESRTSEPETRIPRSLFR